MTNRRWILFFALLLFVSAAAALFMPRGGESVGIWQEGELVYTLQPALLTETREYVLSYEAGETVIHAGHDGIWILSADCKNQNCVRHGPLKPGGTPIVCLPERIVIRYMEDETLDAVSG